MEMENAFGYDFKRVRIHRDAEAGEISQQLSALAFTYGGQIYFGKGTYDPAGSSGKRLLAHELAHVVQHGYAAPLGNGIVALPSAAIQTSIPSIQRFSYFEGGDVHQTNNLADTVLYGKDAGNTIALLNGTNVMVEPVRKALKRPTLTVSPVASGGFDAKVRNVPINKGRFEETILAARRWILSVPKSIVRKKFPELKACKSAGKTNFQAIGMPSEAALFGANRRHEDRHARDIASAFMGTICQWDTFLDIAACGATTYHGSTKAEAEAKLYAEMGGTPDQIADAFNDAASAAIVKFHDTPEGGSDHMGCRHSQSR